MVESNSYSTKETPLDKQEFNSTSLPRQNPKNTIYTLHQKLLKRLHILLCSSSYIDTSKPRSLPKRLATRLLTSYPANRAISYAFAKASSFFNAFPCGFMGLLYHGYGAREVMNKEIFYGLEYKGGKVTKTYLEFEGQKWRVPADIHAYLARIYGDYMSLPPCEERGGHGVYYVNLDLPYRLYKYITPKLEGNVYSSRSC